MHRNQEIENHQSKSEKSEASESSNRMLQETIFSDRADSTKAFEAMQGSRNNSASFELPSLTLVDVSALAKGIDEHGYFVGGQANQLRSQMGNAAADAAMNDARMLHASNLTTNSTPQDSQPVVHSVAAQRR